MSVSRKEAVAKLWELNNLQWKLDSTQKILHADYSDSNKRTLVWACSRRLGKSYTLCVIAIETCLKNPNSIVKYVAPEQKMVKTILRPLLRDILQDCPAHLRPKYFTQDSIWRFPNGSEIQIAGTDNGRAESLRGGNAHLCIVDEAGFCDDLEYLVQSVLLPTLTTTNGKIILSSTSPPSPEHPFAKVYMARAEREGTLIKKTIFDNPRLTKEKIDEIIRAVAADEKINGDPYKHSTVRREYFCEIIVDKTRAIVPEWSPELEAELVTEWVRPPFLDTYVSMDIGFNDLTVALFAYYDFRHSKLIIEDEVVMNGPEMTTENLAKSIRETEQRLWFDPVTKEALRPYIRVSDNNLIVLNDLQALHKLLFIPTMKDDADAALNHMRMQIASKAIIIHPRCKTLISHLKNGIWNKSRTSFERSDDMGHFDGIEALKYLVRNINYTHNPYPANFDMPRGVIHENPWYGERELTALARHFKQLFTPSSSVKKNR